MSLNEMAERGFVATENISNEEILSFLESARHRIEEAERAMYPESKLMLAHSAIISCAVGALAVYGYRLKAMFGHHVHAITSLKYTIAVSDEMAGKFHEIRKKRNREVYGGKLAVTEQDAKQAIAQAAALVQMFGKVLEDRGILSAG